MDKRIIFIFVSLLFIFTIALISGGLYSEDNFYGTSVDTPETPTNFSIQNVSSADLWDTLDTINTTQMEDNGGVLNILVSWLNSFLIPYTGADKNIDFGANNFTVDTRTLFIDSSSNRVGIGTTSPSDKLDVAGNARVDRLILDRGVQSPYLLAGTSKDIRFFTIDSERMRIKEGGNVGIGTSTPQNKLNVLGAGNFTGNLIIGTSASPQNLTMFSPDGTSWSCGVLNDGTFACV